MRSLSGTLGVPRTCESGGGTSVSRGFTLIELLVTLTIFALLVSLAAPSYQNLRQRSQVRSALSALADAVALARAEAVTRGVPVDICPLVSADAAVPQCANTNTWEAGFMVCPREEAAGIGRCTDAASTVGISNLPVQVFEAQPTSVSVRASGFTGETVVTFEPDGSLFAAGNFTICSDGSTTSAQALMVNVAGLSRVAVDSDGDGLVNVSATGQISCP